MDFFSATPAHPVALAALSSPTVLSTEITTNPPSSTDAFAEAINARYSRKGSTLLIPLSPAASSASPSQLPRHIDLSVPIPAPTKPSSLPAMPPSAPPSSDDFTPVVPSSLRDVLDTALIIDIRPHNAHALARLPNALSLSVPSTLIKRPLFSLEKLSQMLSSAQARDKFLKWPNASTILVYDADSAILNEGGNLLGLLRKFRKEGFTRQLFWLKGGFKAVWRESLELVDQERILDDDDAPISAAPMPAVPLRAKQLPMSAFAMTSTTSSRQILSTPAVGRGSVDPFSMRLPPQMSRLAGTSTSSALSTSSLPAPSVSGPSFPNASTPARPGSLSLHLPTAPKPSTIPEGTILHSFPPLDASSLPTGGINAAYNVLPRPHYKSMPGGTSMAFNPFFDNIRQNIELGGGRGSGEGIPLKLPRRVRRRIGELPFEWLRVIGRRCSILDDSEESGSDIAAERMDRETSLPSRVLNGSRGSSRDEGKGRVLKKQSRKPRGRSSRQLNVTSSSSESHSPPPDSSSVSHSASASKANSKAGSASPPPQSFEALASTPSAPPALASDLFQVTRTPASDSDTSGEDLTKALAMQFYKIELGEQRRLMGVMEHHSKESTTVPSSTSTSAIRSSQSGVPGSYAGVSVLSGPRAWSTVTNSPSGHSSGSAATTRSGPGCFLPPIPSTSAESAGEGVGDVLTHAVFPYSITAGVEKGEKNRYRNIWPFEHARVRLRKSCPEDDDYMNASYVQPLGTKKRYIATQGPLPATFADFWTLCWQENVHVIVMLTREVESALIKCGNYWAEGSYGSLRLKLLSTTDSPEREKRRKEREMSSGFFNFPQLVNTMEKQKEKEEHTIRRVFELTNSRYPDAPPRTVTQLQYLEWPDLDVPKDPQGLLELMEEVDQVVENSRANGDMRWGEGPLGKMPSGTPPKERPCPATDDVDPTTGISKRAVGRAPVLLHCSAGVGRTGGFIAVDAVLDGIRREMRKRQDQRTDRRSDNRSRSRSPLSTPEGEHDETMDVDRTSASPLGPLVQDTGITLPMSAGGNEVHVPIVATSSGQVPMDVDGEVVTEAGRQGTLKASSSLLGEMRNGHAAYVAAVASQGSSSTRSPFPTSQDIREKFANIHSTLYAGNGQSDAGSSGASSTGRSASAFGQSVMSSSHTSTTSLTQAIQSVDPTFGSEHNVMYKSTSGDSESTARPGSPSSQGKLSNMNSWRTAVSNTQSYAPGHSDKSNAPLASLQSPRSVQDTILASPRGITFDYVEPRKLHGNVSPPVLSTYDEPIRRVIEDMREQRMSLCQSLRQYVFVHRAIIEGALRIVDQEKRRAEQDVARQPAMTLAEDVEMPLWGITTGLKLSPSPSPAAVRGGIVSEKATMNSPTSPMPVRPPGLDRMENMGLGSALALEERSMRSSPLSQVVSVDAPMDAVAPSGSSLSPRTKRQASPAELVLEDAKGERRLTKRASIKRRAVTPPQDDGNISSSGGMKIGSLVLSSPPPPIKH